MSSLEIEKEALGKELEEKEKIIEAQKKELLQKQQVINKQEKTVANLKIQKQKVQEIKTLTIIKERQIKLIACSKKILKAGANVAEASYRYVMAIWIIEMKKIEESCTTCEDKYAVEPAVNDNELGAIIDSKENIAFEKEWEKRIADEVLTELEEAIQTDNYEAMKTQQSKYSTDAQGEIASIEKIKKDVESSYSKVCIPSRATHQQVIFLNGIIVKFAVGLNSFQEAINSMYEEGFDLTKVILLSLDHPAYEKIVKLLKIIIDSIAKAAKWLENAMKSADNALKRACSLQ